MKTNNATSKRSIERYNFILHTSVVCDDLESQILTAFFKCGNGLLLHSILINCFDIHHIHANREQRREPFALLFAREYDDDDWKDAIFELEASSSPITNNNNNFILARFVLFLCSLHDHGLAIIFVCTRHSSSNRICCSLLSMQFEIFYFSLVFIFSQMRKSIGRSLFFIFAFFILVFVTVSFEEIRQRIVVFSAHQ